MLQLPFEFPPTQQTALVGKPEHGGLRIPKYGDLTPNERIWINGELKRLGVIGNNKRVVQVARLISVKLEKPFKEVYEALIKDNKDYLIDYLEELLDFQEERENNALLITLVKATAIIKFRIKCKQPNSGEKEVWELENTCNPEQVHPLLVDALAEFAFNEENGWPEPESNESTFEELTEEQLGNLPTPQIQTGQESTGDVEDTGPTTEDLTEPTSETSQPG
jgi:hypothetical protein